MTDKQLETILRAAKPEAQEIAPLSPESSNRILQAALRANRRPTRSTWLGMPWRVAAGAIAFGALAFVFLPRFALLGSDTHAPVSDMPQTSVQNTHSEKSAVTPSSKPRIGETRTSGVVQSTIKRVLPSLLPKPFRSHYMLAQHTSPRPVKTATSIPSKDTRIVPKVAPTTPGIGDDSGMYVAVSSSDSLPPVEQQQDGLIVSVKNDVPDSVPGTAEAASLQVVAVPQETVASGVATPDQKVPVWTQAHVESGVDSTVTLTALR